MRKPLLLIVEDDISLNTSLSFQLKKQYRIHQVPSLQAAFACLGRYSYDLLLLDRTLPDGDGLELLQVTNREYPHTKVCVMSQKGSLPERLRGLQSGADQYLPKPFHPQELVISLKILQRRGKLYEENILRRKTLELHLDSHVLRRGELTTVLTPRETQFIELFLNTNTSIVTREQIQNWFWINGAQAEDYNIHVSAQRLRKKLQAIRGTIVAHYGTGYELRLLE